MRIPIQSAADLGAAIRAVRRLGRVRIDDLAATAGVSKQFTQDVEHGKPTVHLAASSNCLPSSVSPWKWIFPTRPRARWLVLAPRQAPGPWASGAESAGSLVLLPPGKDIDEPGDLRPPSDDVLAQRIRNLPRVPLGGDAPKRMSLAGAQSKLLVVYRGGRLFEPVGSEPSTHILKPNHVSDDYPASVINEYFTMRLARCRLDYRTARRDNTGSRDL